MAGVVVPAIALLAAPAYLDPYWIRVLTYALMFAAMSTALNITAGFTGYPAFGDVVWFGLGSVVTGVMMVKAKLPFAACIPISVLFATAIAAIVGPSLVRLRGHSCASGTLARHMALGSAVTRLEATGEPDTTRDHFAEHIV